MSHSVKALALEWSAIGFWGFIAYKEFFARKRLAGVFALPGKVLRLALLLLTLGLLAGCATSDPLAVASGPVFQLNPGLWQPSKEALAAPPVVVAN
jgi:hypothetical protein